MSGTEAAGAGTASAVAPGPADTSAARARTRDGIDLRLRHWPAPGAAWASVLVVHGIAEHAGRYERVGRELAAAGLDVHAFDLRGHGESGGRRVHVARWDLFLDDVEDRLAGLPAARPRILLGHSMGALLSLGYCLDGRPAPDLLVLSAPALRARVPAWQRLAAPVLGRLAPTLSLANPIDLAQLARDPAVGAAYDADPLVRQRTTARLGWELFRAMDRAAAGLAALRVPTLVVHGGDDRLVPPAASEPLAALPGVERRVYPGLRHETLQDPEAPAIVADIVAWLRARLVGG
ncbi:MAG TPA: alpha/beta hydrolase [Candidatus Limnocylindrales bacterium]